MGNHGEQKDAKTRYLPLPTVLQEYRTVSTDRSRKDVYLRHV